DPDDGDPPLDARLHVVVIAGRDMDPAALGTDAALALDEVRRVRLIGADLLRGHDKVEIQRDLPSRLAEELVVDVRDQANFVLLGDLLENRAGLPERTPALYRVGQEPGPRRLERPP